MTQLEDLPPLREVISAHGLNAKKSLGQNFLLDLNLTRKIARQAAPLEGYTVLEVGPGPGGLTRALLIEGADSVLAIERDERCLQALAEINTASRDRLKVVNGDALQQDLMSDIDGPVRIVSNLPYNVGTELLVRWMTPAHWLPRWTSLTLMFQKEVAQRIVAQPGTKAYGRLAILAQWRSRAKIVMDLPPQAFTPPPKVSSAVVHIEPTEPKYAAEPKALEQLVAKAFGQRRKMLRACLKSLHPEIEDILNSCGIAPTQRAETVSIEKFCELSEALRSAG